MADVWFDAAQVVLSVALVVVVVRLVATARASEASAQRAAERAQLLGDAIRELELMDDERDVLRALPGLVRRVMPVTHATVLVPDGPGVRTFADLRDEHDTSLLFTATSITGQAAAAGTARYVPDARREPAHERAPGAAETRSELALPITSRDHVVAVLNLEREAVDAFAPADRAALTSFARLVGERLEALATVQSLHARQREWELLARLQAELLQVDTMARAAAVTLAASVDALRIDAGMAFVRRAGRLRPLARQGSITVDLARMAVEGITNESGVIGSAWESGSAAFFDDVGPDTAGRTEAVGASTTPPKALAIVPVPDAAGRTVALLALATTQRPRAWSDADRRMAANVATALGAVLERVRLTQQLDELLAISRHLTRTNDAQRLYAEVVESAVRVIPGADAASIMLRVGDGYRFVAAVGHDLAMLRSMAPLSEADQLAWHGLGEAAYRAGTPRVLSGPEIVAASTALTGDEGQRRAFEVGGRIHALRANLAVPIADSHEVLGVLNVDSLSHADAFGPSSLRLAEAFAQQAGAIIRQVQYREALERSAVTDPVTKLGNREGFNQRLHVELARARRHGHRVSLVMIDLDGFKAVNDRLGHPMGDRALLLVADAMRRERRPFDGLFRWGGDEFAVLLPEVGPEGAHAGARRYVDAIHEVEVGGLRMAASFGTASFPVDGEDADALLRRADDLMYRAKHRADGTLHGA